MFGISGNEFFVLLLVLVVVIGPQRLPEYTRKLTQWIRQLRLFLDNAKAQIAEEVGPELADLNLQDLNPRNYDPRKIVRDALGEDIESIRRDLTQPFESFSAAAKESSDAAAAAVSKAAAGDGRKLSEMIDEKAGKTGSSKVAATAAAGAAAAAKRAEEQERKSPEAAAAEAEAVTAELPQVDASGAQEPFDVDVLTEEEEVLAAGAARGSAVLPGLDAERSAEHRRTRETGTQVAFAVADDEDVTPEDPADETASAEPEEVEDQQRRDVLAGAVDAVVGAAQAAEAAVDLVPDTLVETTAPARVRPLSPRDVLRASRAAERTPRAALTVPVD